MSPDVVRYSKQAVRFQKFKTFIISECRPLHHIADASHASSLFFEMDDGTVCPLIFPFGNGYRMAGAMII